MAKKTLTRRQRDHRLCVNALRRTFSRSELHKRVLNKTLCKKKGPRGGKMYKCSSCNKCHGRGKIEVDHIDPIVEIGNTVDSYELHEYYIRLYDYSYENLQVLCKKCHKKKSKKENAERKRLRKEAKKCSE